MSLFQKSVEKKYLTELDSVLIDQKYKQFQDYFENSEIQENIRNAKEEQFQEGFLRELFVSIFGYTLNPNPNFNLTTELKNIINSKKADGAILLGEDAIAVIELKGTNTLDLDKIEVQAFGYKNHHPKCIYVITSNFEKLRFYIQNAVDHLDFDLFNLSREQFSIMWLCLAKDNLLNGIPQKIKESSLLQEENITKKLYADYSKFREAIYNNLVKNNPETDKLLLFKKTQKLLDRFLFILFAEDRLLLPPNSISEIVKQWATLKDELDEYVPLYDRFKKYFGYMNTGYKGKKYEIFAYNGGLFAPDEILDNISIDDDILHKHTLILSQYDFETDVDVNILGHIFEYSLGEIENVQAEIKGEKVESQKTKRKKDGIFYTPKYITKYIVENTVGKLCEEKRTELDIVDEEYAKGRKNRKKETIKSLDDKLTDYRNWLLNLTILDPACGSGAFLNQALDFLIIEHRKIDDLRAQLLGGDLIFSDIATDILEKNIYGVDLNEESVEIAKLSLWLRTAQKGRKLNKLNNNIKCGNSLIDDPEVAGDKAFNWHQEFPNIFREKQKKAWHVTWVTHDTRTSERMIRYRVRRPRATGELHIDRSIYLDNDDALKVAEILEKIISEDQYNCLEFNICSDHVHIILVCEEEELSNIVRKLKGKSAQLFKEHLGIQKDETFNLWAQKFDRREVDSEKYLKNVEGYIHNNREKHNLPDIHKGLQPLVDRMICSHDHAFRTEYKGGFDVVIGNPPYVRAELLGFCRDYLAKNYGVFNPSGDLFSYFYEQSFKLLKKHGLFGFISNTFDKTTAGISVRDYLQNKIQFLKYIDFTEVQIFEGATTYPVIIIAKNQHAIDESFEYIKIPKSSQSAVIDIDFHELVSVDQTSLDIENWSFKSNHAVELIEKLKQNKTVRDVYGKCYYGVKTALNEAFILPNTFPLGEHVKPIYEGKELEKWIAAESVQQLILFESRWTKKSYGNEISESEAIEKLKMEFPNLIHQILQFDDRAKNRFDKGDFFWELRNCAYYDLFEKPKVVFPNLQNSNKFAYDETGTYINAPAVILPTNDKFLVAIFNSKLVWYFLTNICVVRNGGYIEVKPQYFEQIPIPNISEIQANELTHITNELISKTTETQKLQSKFHKLVLSKYSNIKLTKKLENWFELDFTEFKKELIKQKITFLLSEESEWIEYFEEQIRNYRFISTKISNMENEVNQLVYQIYGLNSDEIKIVEGNV